LYTLFLEDSSLVSIPILLSEINYVLIYKEY